MLLFLICSKVLSVLSCVCVGQVEDELHALSWKVPVYNIQGNEVDCPHKGCLVPTYKGC